jgi:N-hydroxyarylamine O-acetyltransferase
MKLQAYLDRIKFDGRARPDLDTLKRLHRGHVENIPYENLDVQFRRPVSRDPAAIFDKIVTRRRGGWCYEMNGLLSWALDEIGFKHTRMAGGVVRALRGDEMIGNHLVLWVHLERDYVADVGFGDGLIEPAPLAAGAIDNGVFQFRLENLGQAWWRFHNDLRGGAPSFDFELKRGDEALLDERCAWLQTSPESLFVQNAVAQRYQPGRFFRMAGPTLKTVRADSVDMHEIASATEYVETLDKVFGLALPEARDLWPRIQERHREVLAQKQREQQ